MTGLYNKAIAAGLSSALVSFWVYTFATAPYFRSLDPLVQIVGIAGPIIGVITLAVYWVPNTQE